MKKYPWDDEPTPLCDEQACAGYYDTDLGGRIVLQPYDYEPDKDGEMVPEELARTLERRLRHALKLVNSLRIDMEEDDGPGSFLDPELLAEQLGDIEEVLTP